MKKIIAMLLTLSMLAGWIAMAPVNAHAEETTEATNSARQQSDREEYLSFELNEDGESYYVSGYTEALAGDLVIPATYNDLPVTAIGFDAFYECATLTGVTIPDSVTLIDFEAFGFCENLQTVTIGSAVLEIDQYAFWCCSNLTTVSLGSDLWKVGYGAFGNCNSLTDVYFAGTREQWNTVTINDRNESLSNATLHIDPEANPEMKPLTYPDSVYTYYTSDGGAVISGLREEIKGYVALPETLGGYPVTRIAKEAFQERTAITGIVIPDTVTEIGIWAFGNCTKLETLILGSGLKTIGQYAFDGCSALTEVTIPASVTTIDNGAFLYCYALEAFNVEAGNTKFSSEGGVLFDKNKTTLLQVPNTLSGSYTVPGTVTAIGKNAFNGCESVTEVILPAGLKTIGEAAFGGCTGLTEMEIPVGVTVISDSAFGGCAFLRDVTIPENVTSIGSGAFAGCEQLESISIPASVTTIGESAFKNCMMLVSVTVPDSVTSLGDSVFSGCLMLGEVKIGEGVTAIGQYSFNNCTALAEVTIPVSVTRVSANAFKNCDALIIVYYPGTQEQWDAVTIATTGNDALLNANVVQPDPCADGHIAETVPGKAPTATETGLTEGMKCSVCSQILIAQEEIPVLVTEGTEGNLKFTLNADGCSYSVVATDTTITGDVVIPATFRGLSVTAIGANAFKDCLSITAVTIPDSITAIGKYAFSNCDAISSIVLPEGITEISPFTFSYCEILATVSIPESVTVIGESAFTWCQNLVNVSIPSSATYIGPNAFRYCRKVPTFSVPAGVTFIGDKAFSACTAADGIWVDASNAYYCSDAAGVLYDINKTVLIRGNGAATGVYVIPDTVVTIEGYAFSDCDGITGLVIPDSVTTIGNYAFSACSSLKTITMGCGVTTVGEGSFQSLNALTDARFIGSQTQWEAITFDEKNDSLVNAVRIAYPKYIKEGALAFAIRADGLSYYLYSCDTTAAGEITIPSVIADWSVTDTGLPVTAIGNTAFKDCAAITGVVIPNGVTSIGEYAFTNCSKLTKVVIPESVTAIRERAFESCTSLSDVAIPSGVTNLGIGVFNNCSSLKAITLPAGITAVGDYAFRKTALTEIVIPQGVKAIGDYAFSNCAALTKVTFSANMKTVGRYAFYNCAALTDVYYDGTQEQWDAITVADYNEPLLNATLHTDFACAYGHTEEIVPGTDATCTELGLTEGKKCTVCGEILIAQEEIPAKGHTEEVIPGYAATCTETGLTDGKKCTVCGETLTAQEEIPALGHTEEIIPGVDATCTETGLTEGKKCTVCGETLTAQEEIPALDHTEEVIPGVDATCTETGLTEGKKCSACGEVLVAQEEIPTLGHTEEVIPGYAATCTETGLTEGKKCTVCGETLTAQEEIPALGHTEEIIPGKAPTATETGLTEGEKCSVCGEILVAQEEIPVIPATGTEGYLTFKLREDKLSYYVSACDKNASGELTIPAVFNGLPVTAIGANAFNGCTALTGVIIPEGVTVLSEYAFANCDKLTKVVIPESVTVIRDRAFYFCASLSDVAIPGGVTTLGYSVFDNCTALTEITIPEGITAIGRFAFRNTGLTEIVIPASVTIVDEYAFARCANLCSVTLTVNLTSVGKYAFYQCTNLTDVYYNGTSVQWKAIAVSEYNEPLQSAKLHMDNACGDGHSFDHEFDATCNYCDFVRAVTGSFEFVNYRVEFSDSDTTHKNVRVEVYKLGDKTVADPSNETALKAIDAKPATHWGEGNINKILLTDAGNYVLLLKYNVGTAAATKVPMVISVSSDPKLIIDKNNKMTVIDNNGANINHRVVVYYLGDQTVEDIYDEAALTAIDSAPETVWQKTRINKLALTKGGNYVLHLCYNVGTGAKQTVAQAFTVESIPTLSVNQNNMLVATEENAENRNHRLTVFYLGENAVEDIYDESAVSKAAVSFKTYWGLSEINKVEIKEGGNYIFHLYYNVGTSAKRTLAIEAILTERPKLSVSADNKLVVTYSDASISNPRAYIYNVGDATVDDIYDEAALQKITTPTQVWGISNILRKQLTPGTYVIHLYYNVAGGAKSTVALKITIES